MLHSEWPRLPSRPPGTTARLLSLSASRPRVPRLLTPESAQDAAPSPSLPAHRPPPDLPPATGCPDRAPRPGRGASSVQSPGRAIERRPTSPARAARHAASGFRHRSRQALPPERRCSRKCLSHSPRPLPIGHCAEQRGSAWGHRVGRAAAPAGGAGRPGLGAGLTPALGAGLRGLPPTGRSSTPASGAGLPRMSPQGPCREPGAAGRAGPS